MVKHDGCGYVEPPKCHYGLDTEDPIKLKKAFLNHLEWMDEVYREGRYGWVFGHISKLKTELKEQGVFNG